jgi:hypothetical protein
MQFSFLMADLYSSDLWSGLPLSSPVNLFITYLSLLPWTGSLPFSSPRPVSSLPFLFVAHFSRRASAQGAGPRGAVAQGRMACGASAQGRRAGGAASRNGDDVQGWWGGGAQGRRGIINPIFSCSNSNRRRDSSQVSYLFQMCGAIKETRVLLI